MKDKGGLQKMDDAISRKSTEALNEYVEAERAYNKLIDKYFPVREVVPGKEIESGEILTEEALKEIEKAEKELEEKKKTWHKLIGL